MRGGHNAKCERNAQILSLRGRGLTQAVIADRLGCSIANVFRVLQEPRTVRVPKEDSKLPKKVLIALPPLMLAQVDQVATDEHRTRSDLIREALRRYLEEFKKKHWQTIGKTALGVPYVQPLGGDPE